MSISLVVTGSGPRCSPSSIENKHSKTTPPENRCVPGETPDREGVHSTRGEGILHDSWRFSKVSLAVSFPNHRGVFCLSFMNLHPFSIG
jgi:hypothetical protein